MKAGRRTTMGAAVLFVTALAVGIWLGTLLDTTPVAVAQIPAVATGDPVPVHHVQASGSIYADDSPIVRVVERVKDAVVNIEAQTERSRDQETERNFLPWFHPPTGRTQSFGSGFFIRPDGTILTNAHVVADADEVTVRLSDDQEYRAEVLGIDEATDLAVIRIDAGDPVPYIEFGNSDDLKIGQWVVAIGNPFPRQHLDRTVTVGVVSGLGRSSLNFGQETPIYQNYIQTDAAINPGNSGGPLVDLHGRVVGINAAIASPSGGNVGIGFAIPSTYVTAILDDLVEKGRVSRGWLGIQTDEVTPDVAEAMDLESFNGVMVARVLDDTPAKRSGLKQGDVILRFNKEQVIDVQQFMFLVAQTRPNTQVQLEIYRNGTTRTVPVTLAERADATLARGGRSPGGSETPDSWFGMRVRTVTPGLAERYSVGYETGVIVTEVEPGSPADDKDIMRGDIVTSVQHEDINGVEDFRRLKSRLADADRAVLFLVIGNSGQRRFVALKDR